jgi:glycosyltransferase involved in cell wall biosynthesis
MTGLSEHRLLVCAAQGPSSPAVRIRTTMLAPALEHFGVTLEPELLFSEEQARAFAAGSARTRAAVVLAARRDLNGRLAASDAPGVLVQRQVDMLPPLRLERMAIAGRRVVLDVDDAIWHDARGGGGHILAVLKASRRKARWLASRADQVIAGNDLLAETLDGLGAKHVAVMPSLVDVEAAPVRRHEQREDILLGWIGSPTTARYLDDIIPAIDEATRRDGRPWTIACAGGAPRVLPTRAELVEIPWSPAAERDLLSRMDIGLMPLPDTPWTRGKCAYKALQYLASGIPVIADDVGVTAAVVGPGVGGLVMSAIDDWSDGLTTLAADASIRARMGAQGRERVSTVYSVTARAAELAGLLTGRGTAARLPALSAQEDLERQ